MLLLRTMIICILYFYDVKLHSTEHALADRSRQPKSRRASLTDKRLYSIFKDRHWCVSFSSVDVHKNNFRNGLSIVSEDRGKDDINVKSLRTDVTGVSTLHIE